MLLEKNKIEKFTPAYVNTFTRDDYYELATHTYILYNDPRYSHIKEIIRRVNQYCIAKYKSMPNE